MCLGSDFGAESDVFLNVSHCSRGVSTPPHLGGPETRLRTTNLQGPEKGIPQVLDVFPLHSPEMINSQAAIFTQPSSHSLCPFQGSWFSGR